MSAVDQIEAAINRVDAKAAVPDQPAPIESFTVTLGPGRLVAVGVPLDFNALEVLSLVNWLTSAQGLHTALQERQAKKGALVVARSMPT